MAKAKWGEKHRCGSCGKAFYDLNKDPIICPSCGVKNIPEKLLKSRKVGTVAAKKKVEPVKVVDAETEDSDLEADLENDAPDSSDDLGSDEDDIAEVVPVQTNDGDS